MVENSLVDLMKFFSKDTRVVKSAEMQAFWKSLTDEEKAYYKAADIG